MIFTPVYRSYLIVNVFLRDFLSSQVLRQAFANGFIDRLCDPLNILSSEVAMLTGGDAKGDFFIISVLKNISVIEVISGEIRLTKVFIKALVYRDLLQAKLEFSSLLTADVTERLSLLMENETRFMQSSKLFEIFDYSRALEYSDANKEFTRQWVNLTTALTKYESQACIEETCFNGANRWLDIGGNSGEFALQLAAAYPDLAIKVLDLPVVCALGEEHISSRDNHERIQFIAGDALQTHFPKDVDVISFKSMLHDWPEAAIKWFLQKAYQHLHIDGRILIFERAALDLSDSDLGYGDLSTLLFFRSYKEQSFYRELLHSVGFKNITIKKIQLESAFHLIEAIK